MFQVITHFSTLCAPSFHSSQLIDESINRTFFGKDVDYCLTLLISFLFWVFFAAGQTKQAIWRCQFGLWEIWISDWSVGTIAPIMPLGMYNSFIHLKGSPLAECPWQQSICVSQYIMYVGLLCCMDSVRYSSGFNLWPVFFFSHFDKLATLKACRIMY